MPATRSFQEINDEFLIDSLFYVYYFLAPFFAVTFIKYCKTFNSKGSIISYKMFTDSKNKYKHVMYLY